MHQQKYYSVELKGNIVLFKKKNCLILICFAVLLPHISLAMDAPIWQSLQNGLSESDIRCVTVSDGEVYAASFRSLYQLNFARTSFDRLLSFPAHIHTVHQIYISSINPQEIYIASDNGVYVYDVSQQTLKDFFLPPTEDAKLCFKVVLFDQKAWVATQDGLYVTDLKIKNWSKASVFAHQEVFHLAALTNFLFAATGSSLWRMDSDGRWEDLQQWGIDIKEEALNGEYNSFFEGRFIRDLFAEEGNEILVATSAGLYQSQDKGAVFKRAAVDHLDLRHLNSVFVTAFPKESRSDLFFVLSSPQGILASRGLKNWTAVSSGMDSNIVYGFALDKNSRLWAATSRGVFYADLSELSKYLAVQALQMEALNKISLQDVEDMPSISDVHQWAIEYADVSSEKIIRWQKLAKRKAMLPDVSLGIDRDAAEYFHWDTGQNPDILQKGRDMLDWDVGITWQLGDLIWNDDATSIDSRSKLMVELRTSILDQVTRIYFERKRLVMITGAMDKKDPLKTDNELRIEELTAVLDAYTDGKFSQNIKTFN